MKFAGSLALSGIGQAMGQVVDFNDAINRAGRQRMLSQRTAKAYLAAGQGVLNDRTHEILSGSIALFDRQLAELKAFAPDAEIRATYGDLEAVWNRYKAVLIDKAPNHASAAEMMALDAQVLALANKGTLQLERAWARPVGKLVNVAGRQRMLSQRVAKLYLAQAWKVPVPDAQAELDKASGEFVSALAVLANAPEATSAIRQEIDLARNQWVFYEAALRRRGADGFAPELCADVFLSSENILSVMDKVTSLYARVAA
jgi:hypothetical protein